MEKTFYCILDSSYLMQPFDVYYWEEIPPNLDRKLTIPNCVKQEIANHLKGDNETKADLARKARARIADFMSWSMYFEIDENTIPQFSQREIFIGADSKVDKFLISLAIHLSEIDDNNIVYLATNDGGIQTELSGWKREGKKIYTRANLLDFKFALVDEWDKIENEIAKVVYGIGDHGTGDYSYDIPRVLTASECFRIFEAESESVRIVKELPL